MKDSSWDMRIQQEGKWGWRCANGKDHKHTGFAPIRVELKIKRQQRVKAPPKVEVHTVEVAVPEIQVVEHEVETTKYIVWDEEQQAAVVQDKHPVSANPLDQIPKAEIRELLQEAVAVELELKEAEEDRQRRQRAAQSNAQKRAKQL